MRDNRVNTEERRADDVRYWLPVVLSSLTSLLTLGVM
jgi:hypothetical protein